MRRNKRLLPGVACTERVNLIVRAMTLRRGLAVGPREITQEDIDQNA